MAYLAIFAPLLGAFLAALAPSFGRRPLAAVGSAACVAVAALASVGVLLFLPIQEAPVTVPILQWVASGGFAAAWTVRLDPLSVTMLLVITWVSTAVHIYSIGYMAKEPAYGRYFALLSLFTFFMALLVVSDDFLQLYFAWEGVGLCSYLLINFWYHEAEANHAALKAFIVNRVGDLGFAVAIMAIFLAFGTVSFDGVFAQAPVLAGLTFPFLGWEADVLTVICLLLLLGAIGKSAQLGLHVWLPDAMAAPTPVSALLHAATMVTAGVFLVVRVSPLFEQAPLALDAMVLIGAVTALMAGSIALVQTDIKRIIAYSTMSQIGFMFLACGVSAYAAAMFHLVTHALFKGLLFLGAGSVIKATGGEQDIRRLGGLRTHLPVTYALMGIGCLALVGLPGFAGFYSKEAIFAALEGASSPVATLGFGLGCAAAGLTALYGARLFLKTFHGPAAAQRLSAEPRRPIREPSWLLLAPAGCLAVGTVVLGSLLEPLLVGAGSAEYWAGALVLDGHHAAEPASAVPGAGGPSWTVIVTVLLSLCGLGLGWLIFQHRPTLAQALAARFHPVTAFLQHRWYFDPLYAACFVRPANYLGGRLAKVVDGSWIDGFGPRALTTQTRALAGLFSRAQTGLVFDYAFAMVLGLVALLSWLLFLS